MGRTRVAIDFASREGAIVFFKDIKASGLLEAGAQLVQMDGLDERSSSGGVTTGNTLLVKAGRTTGVVAQ